MRVKRKTYSVSLGGIESQIETFKIKCFEKYWTNLGIRGNVPTKIVALIFVGGYFKKFAYFSKPDYSHINFDAENIK